MPDEASHLISAAGSAGGGTPPQQQQGSARNITFVLLCAASLLDAMNRDILGALLRTFEMTFGVDADDLSLLLLSGSLALAISSLVWGFLADTMSRRLLMTCGALGWGLFTLCGASAQSFWVLCLCRALTGIALAAVTPLVQGLVVDLVPPARRGVSFGTVGVFSGIGTTLAVALAPIVGGAPTETLGAHSGWRVLMGALGVASLGLACAVWLCMVEPRRTSDKLLALNTAEAANVAKQLVNTPTFVLVLLQGVFGSIPWSATSGFLPLFLQYAGLSDAETSLVLLAQCGAGAGSMLIGGAVGDAAAARLPDTGRVRVAQLSVGGGLLMMLILLQGITPSESSFGAYLAAAVGFGIIASWCLTGVNQPLLADVVPESMRATAMASEWGIESAVAAILGAPLVGLLAKHVFGYTASPVSIAETDDALQAVNAEALRSALTWLTVVPWAACLICYHFVSYSYPRDRDRVRAAAGKQPLAAAASDKPPPAVGGAAL